MASIYLKSNKYQFFGKTIPKPKLFSEVGVSQNSLQVSQVAQIAQVAQMRNLCCALCHYVFSFSSCAICVALYAFFSVLAQFAFANR